MAIMREWKFEQISAFANEVARKADKNFDRIDYHQTEDYTTYKLKIGGVRIMGNFEEPYTIVDKTESDDDELHKIIGNELAKFTEYVTLDSEE